MNGRSLLLLFIVIAACVAIGFGGGYGYYGAFNDSCATVQNAYGGSAWASWHAHNSLVDIKRGQLSWADREGMDIGCALKRAGH